MANMKIKYNTWTGTYWVYEPRRPVQLRQDVTPKMRKVMKENEPRLEKGFKIWEDK